MSKQDCTRCGCIPKGQRGTRSKTILLCPCTLWQVILVATIENNGFERGYKGRNNWFLHFTDLRDWKKLDNQPLLCFEPRSLAEWWCQLQIDTCHGTCHLPLQGLNQVLLQLLTFNIPWKEFSVESRNEALCALGKTGRTDLQIVIHFQELILWAQFLYLVISRKALKSFMVTSGPCDWQ